MAASTASQSDRERVDRQFRAAVEQVGKDLYANGEWLLRFASMDLQKLDPLSQITLWRNLVAVAVLAGRKPNFSCPVDVLSEAEYPNGLAALTVWDDPTESVPRRDASRYERYKASRCKAWLVALLDIQGAVNRTIGEVIQHTEALKQDSRAGVGAVSIELYNVLYEIDFTGQPRMRFHLGRLGVESNRKILAVGVRSAVLARLVQVLAAFPAGFRACKGCGQFYLAKRRDQWSCTYTCRMREFMRQKRADDQKKRERTPRGRRLIKGGKRHGTKRR